MNSYAKTTEQKSPKGLSKGARIGAIIGAGVGAVLMAGPLGRSGLLVQFGVFFVLNLVGMGLGSLFSLGARRQGEQGSQ